MRNEHQGDETQSDSQKDFVLDTNVILHDSACLYHFEEHNIHIPISVLEELDQWPASLLFPSCTPNLTTSPT